MRTFKALTENDTQYWVSGEAKLTNIGPRVPEGTEVREEELLIEWQRKYPSGWQEDDRFENFPTQMKKQVIKAPDEYRQVATLKAKAEPEQISGREKIESYIKEKRYTWDFDSIMEAYEKYKNKEYVSHTAKDVIKNCIENPNYNPVSPLKDREQPWISMSENPLTQDTGEVIGFHPDWINEDFNPNGTRIGFIGGKGTFISAFWLDYQDSYTEKDDVMPTHYMIIPSTKSLRQ